MLELTDIDLRLSENVVDSGKLNDIAQAKNLRSQIVDSGKMLQEPKAAQEGEGQQ